MAHKVGDREIERLMVDGDDLFEKGYKVLSKNMTSDAVDKLKSMISIQVTSYSKALRRVTGLP